MWGPQEDESHPGEGKYDQEDIKESDAGASDCRLSCLVRGTCCDNSHRGRHPGRREHQQRTPVNPTNEIQPAQCSAHHDWCLERIQEQLSPRVSNACGRCHEWEVIAAIVVSTCERKAMSSNTYDVGGRSSCPNQAMQVTKKVRYRAARSLKSSRKSLRPSV